MVIVAVNRTASVIRLGRIHNMTFHTAVLISGAVLVPATWSTGVAVLERILQYTGVVQ